MSDKDKMQNVLGQAWLRAAEAGEVRLDLPTKAARTQMRMMLYNFAKGVKKRPEAYAAKIQEAVENCMISQDGDLGLIIRQRTQSPVMQALIQQLGLDTEAPQEESAEAKAIRESAERLQAKVGTGGGAPKNPYY